MSHSLRFEPHAQVLLIEIKGDLTDAAFLAVYDAVEAFMVRNGPCSALYDFTAVTHFQMSVDFIREIGVMRSAVPPGGQRIVVAPQPAIYRAASAVAALREGGGATIEVFPSMDEAHAALGLVAPDFAPVA